MNYKKANPIVEKVKQKGFEKEGDFSKWFIRYNGPHDQESIYLCTGCRKFQHYINHIVVKTLSKSAFKKVGDYLNTFE